MGGVVEEIPKRTSTNRLKTGGAVEDWLGFGGFSSTNRAKMEGDVEDASLHLPKTGGWREEIDAIIRISSMPPLK